MIHKSIRVRDRLTAGDLATLSAKSLFSAVVNAWRINRLPAERLIINKCYRVRLNLLGVSAAEVVDALLRDHPVEIVMTKTGQELFFLRSVMEDPAELPYIRRCVAAYENAGHRARKKRRGIVRMIRDMDKLDAMQLEEAIELPPLDPIAEPIQATTVMPVKEAPTAQSLDTEPSEAPPFDPSSI